MCKLAARSPADHPKRCFHSLSHQHLEKGDDGIGRAKGHRIYLQAVVASKALASRAHLAKQSETNERGEVVTQCSGSSILPGHP